jgi:outer membrane receptor protein involved in Fe transport
VSDLGGLTSFGRWKFAALLLVGAAWPLAASAHSGADSAEDAAAAESASSDTDIVINGHRETGERVSPVTLSVQPAAGIASVYSLGQGDIQGMAITTANDLLRSIPGVQVANLGNGGIPNGVTIRGWGLVSDGTAVRGVVDGYTRNFVWGPNGNGSDDLNVLIPEIVQSIDVIKGPFDTRYSGNYAYAGTAIFTTADSAPNRVQISGGSFGKARLVATAGNGEEPGPTKFYVAVDASTENGRRENNAQNKVNLFGKLTAQLGSRDVLKITGQLYNNVYGQPGYIRSDLVDQGRIGEHSATDNSAKGYRHSQTVTAEWQHRDDVFNFDANGWVEHLRQYRSIERQDIEVSQYFPANIFRDKRWSTGFGFNPWADFTVAGIDAIVRAGAEIRGDFVDTVRAPGFDNQLAAQPTQLDVWTGFFNYVEGHVWNPDVFGELSLKPASWIKVTGGVRQDWFNYNANVTYYPGTALGIAAPFSPGPPTGKPTALQTVHYNSWSNRPTLHGGIAISPGGGFTLLGNFGEGITSQWASTFSVKGGVNYPTLYLSPDLRPTKLNTKEVVLKYDNQDLGLFLQGGYYSTLNQGEIGTDPVSGNPVNLGKSIRKGFDIDGRVRLYDRDGTSLRIGGNYNQVRARLRPTDAYVIGTPPWTAGWNLDAATPVGPDGRKLRLNVQQNFVGGTYLTATPTAIVVGTSAAGNVYGTGILRNGDYNRLAVKLQYEQPSSRNLHLWVSGIFYGGDRFAEMTTTAVGFFNNSYTTRGVTYRVGNPQPPFQAEVGASIDF